MVRISEIQQIPEFLETVPFTAVSKLSKVLVEWKAPTVSNLYSGSVS